MLHRTRRIIIFCLLGAIVNIAVAWGCAMWSPILSTDRDNDAAQLIELGIGYTQQSELQFAPQWMIAGETSDGQFTFEYNPAADGPPTVVPERTSCGWPLRSLVGSIRRSDDDSSVPDSVVIPGRFRFLGARSRLPSQIMWREFLFNTLFYALLLWIAFAAPFTLRRRLRLRRGHCPRCNYPFGVSPTCTECGLDPSPWNGRPT